MHSKNLSRFFAITFLIGVLLVISITTQIPSVNAAPILIANPSFELPGTGPSPNNWAFTTTILGGTDFISYYPVTPPPLPHSGSHSVGIIGFNPQWGSHAEWNQYSAAPVNEGVAYNLSSWIWLEPIANPIDMEVDIGLTWLDLTGLPISTHWSTTVSAPPSIWFEHFVILQAPLTAKGCSIHLRVTLYPTAPYDVPLVYFDDVELNELDNSVIGDNTPGDHGNSYDPTADSYNEMLQLNITATWEGLKNLNFTLFPSGTGDDQADIAEVDLFHDVNGNGGIDPGTDLLLGAGTYPGDNTPFQLNTTHSIVKGQSHLLLFVYQMNFNGNAGETYGFNVTQIRVEGNSTSWFYNLPGTPFSSAIKTLVGSLIVEEGPLNPSDHDYTPVPPYENIMLHLQLTAYYENFTVSEMTIQVQGNYSTQGSDEPVAKLYYDADNDGNIDAVDILLDNDTGPSITFTFTFMAPKGITENFFIILWFTGSLVHGSTFEVEVTNIIATGHIDSSTTTVGLPITSATKTIITAPTIVPIIPGFPFEAILLALIGALGLGFVTRHKRKR